MMSTVLLVVGLVLGVLLFLFWGNEQVMKQVKQNEADDNRPLRLPGEDDRGPDRLPTER